MTTTTLAPPQTNTIAFNSTIESKDLVEDIICEIGRSDFFKFRNGELQIQNPVDLQSLRFIPEQT